MKRGIRITAAALAALALMHGSADIALGSPNRAKNRYYYEERGDMIWEVQTSQKVIALTFDDGPDPFETDGILEVLHEYNAKCTFLQLANGSPLIPRSPDASLMKAMSLRTIPIITFISKTGLRAADSGGAGADGEGDCQSIRQTQQPVQTAGRNVRRHDD